MHEDLHGICHVKLSLGKTNGSVELGEIMEESVQGASRVPISRNSGSSRNANSKLPKQFQISVKSFSHANAKRGEVAPRNSPNSRTFTFSSSSHPRICSPWPAVSTLSICSIFLITIIIPVIPVSSGSCSASPGISHPFSMIANPLQRNPRPQPGVGSARSFLRFSREEAEEITRRPPEVRSSSMPRVACDRVNKTHLVHRWPAPKATWSQAR